MTTKDTTKTTQSIKKAAAESDTHALLSALEKLFAELGDQAMEYAVRFALPPVREENYTTQLATWLEACRLLAGRRPDAATLMGAVEGLAILQQVKVTIANLLESSPFYQDSIITQLGRTSAFVLDQKMLMRAHVQVQTEHLHEALGAADIDSILTEDEGAMVSPLAGNEANHERLELIVRHVLHKHTRLTSGALDLSRGPYLEPDFQVVWTFAAAWRLVENVETSLRSGYWTTKRTNNDSIVEIVPISIERYMLDVLGRRRETLYYERRIAAYLIRLASTVTDSPEAVAKVAASVTFPDAGAPWDGNLDCEALRLACSRTSFGIAMNIVFSERMYSPLTKGLRVGAKSTSVAWPVWVRAYEVLRILSNAWIEAFQAVLPDAVGGNDCMKGLLIVRRRSLVELLVSVGELDSMDAEAACQLLIFDPKRRRLDLWGQPILPCGQDFLIIVTTALLSANPRHLVELAVKEWSGSAFDVRGGPFESRIENIWTQAPGARVKARIAFVAADGKEVEFDVVTWWEDQLWITEAKCLKAVLNDIDYAEASKVLAKSVAQLMRQKEIVLSQWELLRKHAKELNLPEIPPERDRVHLVSATSIFNFTGLQIGGAFVTDHLSLGRFFENGQFTKWRISPNEITHDSAGPRIWSGNHPTATELLSYLASPPQVEAAAQGFSLTCMRLPRINAEDDEIRTLLPQFLAIP
jgi:hypothetical protein